MGRYTGEIGEHLAAEGHAVCVITTPPHYPQWRAFESSSGNRYAREQLAGADVYRCPLYLNVRMKGARRLLAPVTFALSSALVALYQAVKRRPQVILVVEPTILVAPIARLAAWLVGARTVLQVQDLEVDAAFAVGHLSGKGGLAKLAYVFERWALCGFDTVITISDTMAAKLQAKGVAADRLQVVRNWVDLDAIKPLDGPSPYRAELGLDDSHFIVLYAGAIGAKQGMAVLIDAIRLLADRPEIVFVVAGEGPLKVYMAEQAVALPNLRLLPFQPEARFSDFLGLADLHVLPQEAGTADLLLPSKLGGMLASGRPIVVTTEAGTELAEFLGETCRRTPPGDGAALAAAIEESRNASEDAGKRDMRLNIAQYLAKSEGFRQIAAATIR